MAFYNSAIYMGRALSFAAVIVAVQLGIKHSELGVTMVQPPPCMCHAAFDCKYTHDASLRAAAYHCTRLLENSRI